MSIDSEMTLTNEGFDSLVMNEGDVFTWNQAVLNGQAIFELYVGIPDPIIQSE